MTVLILRSGVASPQAGSLAYAGGASTANSPTVRMLRTGAMDFDTATIELHFRVSATAADNNQEIAPGANYNLTNCNIIADGDSVNTRGYIIGLSGGMLCFGINTSGGARTIQGTTDVRDFTWRHAYFYRNGATMRIGLDGVREVNFTTAPTGLITYDGDSPATDQYLYWCKEKLNATFGCDCEIGPIRISSNERYPGATYTVPTAPFTNDADTIAFWNGADGSGSQLTDGSGNGFHGELLGSPLPTWGSGPFA